MHDIIFQKTFSVNGFFLLEKFLLYDDYFHVVF